MKEAIEEIVEEIPRLNKALIDPEMEDPRPNTLIIINGKEINVLDDLETILRDGDDVVLIPVLHAG